MDFMKRYAAQQASKKMSITKAGYNDYIAAEAAYDIEGNRISDSEWHFTLQDVEAEAQRQADANQALQNQLTDTAANIASVKAVLVAVEEMG